MTITQLEYVVAVANQRSFAAAADQCHVTQPTLSIQIRKLEDELGVVLFDRSRQPVLPTDIGNAVVEQARQVIQEAARIDELIKAHQGDTTGELRVAVIPTLSPYLLPRFASAFTARHPGVELVVEELLSAEILEMLRSDRLDVGIMVPPRAVRDFKATPLFREEFLLYLSPRHRMCSLPEVDLRSLDTHDMWLLADGHCFRDQIETLCGERMQAGGAHAPLRFQSGSLETIKRIVDRHGGYTLLPELAVLELSARERRNVRRFRHAKPMREIALVTRRSFLKERLIEALRTTILESIPAEMRDRRRGHLVEWNGTDSD